MPGSRMRSGLEAITDPVLYAKVVDLFSRAVALEPEEQSGFLEAHCNNNPDILRLLKRLLSEDRDGSLVASANRTESLASLCLDRALASPDEDLTGRTLSHYEIAAPIASGGMGVIYRALDTRLGRSVALKFLPPVLLEDSQSRERFLREARAIASIDHPNVCTVYEIDEADGRLFLAMADLHGITLAEKLEKGPMDPNDSIDIAIQTARGLQAAHSKGIVHRDIKPSNLMLLSSEDGPTQVRILDFGIASWINGNTFTEAGLAIGTVSYMSPEQVSGARVDGRSDLWSLGVVLHEMLSGHVPFNAGSVQETLIAIAGPATVDLSAWGDRLAPEVLSILRTALSKDPDQRYRQTSEFLADLERARIHLVGDRKHRLSRPQGWLAWTGGFLSVGVAIAIALFSFIQSNARRETRRPEIIPFTFDPGHQISPAISPDGKQIAFSGEGKYGTNPLEIYVQLIGSTDALQLTSAPAGLQDRFPAWDPSGARIAFLRAKSSERFARLLIVSSLGGSESDVGADGVLRSGKLAWSPNGRGMAFTGLNRAGDQAIFELSMQDHSVQQRSFPAPGQSDCCPQYDLSGNRLAFLRDEVEIVVARSDGTQARTLRAHVSWPGLTWNSDGRSILYSWFGKLAKIELATGSISHPELGADASDLSIRGNRMTFVKPDLQWSIWMVDVGTGDRKFKTAGTQKVHLITSTRREDTPQFSPDGQRIAFASDRSSLDDIWIGNRDGTHLRRLTYLDGQSAGTPRWSPDGKWIAFDSRQHSAKPAIWIVWAAGGEPRQLSGGPEGSDVPSWSHDGRWIYYHSPSDDQIWKQPPAGGTPIQVTRTGGFEGFESVDGRFFYYSKSDGTSGIWRENLITGDESPVLQLARAGQFRQWALAPHGILYVPNNEAFSSDAVIRFFDFATQKTLKVAAVGPLLTVGPGALAVSPDGKSLLCVQVDRDNRNIMLVKNFSP